jgi:hypothetical protein
MKNIFLIAVLVIFHCGISQAAQLQVNAPDEQTDTYQAFKKVKAMRCSRTQRSACDDPIYLNLNQATDVPAGAYILGFENSIYPGWVDVQDGTLNQVDLKKISPTVRGQNIKAYRDMSASLEQGKVLWSVFAAGRHFFREEKDNFGDFYLTDAWERDYVQRINYDACAQLKLYPDAQSSAKTACATWTNAKNSGALASLFNFDSKDGTFTQLWVTYPGDAIPTKHFKYLVAVPMPDSAFIYVFPGVYKFQNEKGQTASVTVSK